MTAANVTDISASAPKPKKKKEASASAVARQAEAESEDGFVTVEQCGLTLRIPLQGHIPLKAIERFRVGDNYGGTKEMIGEEQWEMLLAAGATDGDLDALGDQITEASGN